MKAIERLLLGLVVLSTSVQCVGRDALHDLVINEFVSENTRLPDRDGNLNGWVELLNRSDNEIQLHNYSISIDTVKNITYKLPAKSLKPGELVIIFFSES